MAVIQKKLVKVQVVVKELLKVQVVVKEKEGKPLRPTST